MSKAAPRAGEMGIAVILGLVAANRKNLHRRGHKGAQRLAQSLAGLGVVALDEVSGSGALFPFELNFQKIERTALGTANSQMIAGHTQFSLRKVSGRGSGLENLQS